MTGTPGLINEAFLRVRLLATRIEGTSSIRVLLDSISTRSFVKQFLFPFFEELLLDVFSHKKLFGLNARTLCDSVRD